MESGLDKFYTIEPVYSKLFEGYGLTVIKAIEKHLDISVIVVADWFWEVIEFAKEYNLHPTIIVLGAAMNTIRLVEAVNLHLDRWVIKGNYDIVNNCLCPSIEREVKEIVSFLIKNCIKAYHLKGE